MLERLLSQKSSRRTLLTSSVGAGLLAAVQRAAPGIAAALGASRASAQSAAKPFRQYLPVPRTAGVGTIRVVDIPEPNPINEATQSISVTACSADGEALQTIDRFPDGSPIQVRNGTYVDLDVSEIFSSGVRWIDVLYDPVLDGTAYFVVSGQKGLQSSYAVEGSGDFRTIVGRAPRSRSQAVFRLTRAFRPVDTNVVMGQDLPDGSQPVFLRSDNPAGGTRLVPGLPVAYWASDIIFQ